METIEELENYIKDFLNANIWNNIADRSTAWSIMRRNGVPPDGIKFGEAIETDLSEYGFALLRAAIALKDLNGDNSLIKAAFEKSAKAFESLILNASDEDRYSDFYRIISAAAYHLAGYSAIAFTIANTSISNGNYSPCETALAYLIVRDFKNLENFVKRYLRSPDNSEESISEYFADESFDLESGISIIINATFCKALAAFDFFLLTGTTDFYFNSNKNLKSALKLAENSSLVTLWWIIRLTIHFLDDLFEHSLHRLMPILPLDNDSEYLDLRENFINLLYGRSVSEIELWPSQVEAAKRAIDINDDLVVALPTSAGKTRIAELAALMTLSTGKRILIVTPLRALSAQTERAFRMTFGPLGFSVSSLYGASIISTFDEDSLRDKQIVITTPEKLDFALRTDGNILNDIGLVILDEGHMIGKTEREIRFEILVQRLLKRHDAKSRRLICLSAILPDGDGLKDLTNWIRSDEEGDAITLKWRPTRQRFGTIIWNGNHANLNYDYKNENPFISRFVKQIEVNNSKVARPNSMQDLTIFSAWEFAKQGKKTLIFVTQANWVEKFGVVANDLVKKGYLESLLINQEIIKRTIDIGTEWLGSKHPAVQALKIGVAIHHGGLPNPFLRELEILLATGVIKVIIASPTLSQGLNINAAVLLVPYLVRNGETYQRRRVRKCGWTRRKGFC